MKLLFLIFGILWRRALFLVFYPKQISNRE